VYPATGWIEGTDGTNNACVVFEIGMSTTTLTPLPDAFDTTREALHQYAFFAIAPRRYAETGRLGLRATPGGFGAPPWPSPDGDVQVRMEGDLLVVQTGEERRATRPTTVQEACDFLGIPYQVEWFADFHDPLKPIDPGTPLEIDDNAATVLGDWFDFGNSVLEELRATPGAVDASEVQLWPEHFDLATELGSADAGQRASYGASPGDDAHPEPYLYVAAWGDVDRDAEPYWNDTTFNGASLAYKELLASGNPQTAALAFLRRGHEVLTGS